MRSLITPHLMTLSLLAAASTFGFAVSPAAAHATLEVKEAAIGGSYKATIRIGHGCDGSATKRLEVGIPAGVIAVKPMPKPGWTLTTTKGDYGRTYDFYHSSKLSSGVVKVVWEGGLLSDDNYDEFVFNTYLTDSLTAGSTIYFPVVQTCEKGEHRWTDLPAAGQDAHALKSPAPGLRLAQARTSTPAAAPTQTVTLKDLVIEAPWSRATPGGAKVAGGYLKITNKGATADRIIGGTLALAKRVEVHSMEMVDGIMKMRQLTQGLEIKPGETVELKPGGNHLMFMELSGGLVEGQRVRATLQFEKSGSVEVDFTIAPIGAAAPKGGHSHH